MSIYTVGGWCDAAVPSRKANRSRLSATFRPHLVFQDKFSSYKCLPSLPTLLDDGVPQQFGRLIHACVQLHHWCADTAAQQLVLPLRRREHVQVMLYG